MSAQLEHSLLTCGPNAQPFDPLPELWMPALAAARLDRCEETLDAHIFDGSLRFAFDFSAPDAGRREVRVWAPSVADLIAGDERRLRRPEDDNELLEVVNLLLPRTAGPFMASEAATRWQISKEHTLRLLRHPKTELRPDARKQAQGTQSPWICRSSAVEFLKARRVL